MSRKPNAKHITFLEESIETILSQNLNFSEIIKLSKEKGIKGLVNNKVRDVLKAKGLEYDSLSKKWVKCPEGQDIFSVTSPELFPPNNDNKTLKDSEQITESPDSKENCPSGHPVVNPSIVNKEPKKNSKPLEELSRRITKQEQLTDDILQKISQIESNFKDKIEDSFRKDSSDFSLNIIQFVELSYSVGKRYEVTLREDLVKKATEKLKSKYNLESVDLTKLSRLFEIILFDYINSNR